MTSPAHSTMNVPAGLPMGVHAFSYRRNSVGVRSHEEASMSYQFTYQGSDGRLKATFEQAFKQSGSASEAVVDAPWELGYQMSEKNLVWNDGLKSRLLSRIAAARLGISDEELGIRLERLQVLLPDLQDKLAGMRPNTVAALLRDVEDLPGRLMDLKLTFPGANVSKLVVREPSLALGFDGEHLHRIAGQLREILPRVDVDRLVEENPSVLDVEELQAAMAEAKRIMPSLDIVKAMANDPQVILSFQRGSQLIPYDPPIPETELEVQNKNDDDDEYAAYYR